MTPAQLKFVTWTRKLLRIAQHHGAVSLVFSVARGFRFAHTQGNQGSVFVSLYIGLVAWELLEAILVLLDSDRKDESQAEIGSTIPSSRSKHRVDPFRARI